MPYRKKTASRSYKKKVNPFKKRSTSGMVAKSKRRELAKLIKDTK